MGSAPHAERRAAVAIELEGKVHIPIHDLQGNVAYLKPPNSKPTLYRYSAFGEEKIFGSAISPWRFSSKRIDSSELVYFGRRYYLPAFGRWLTKDPSGFTDGMNLYAYIHNEPLTQFDEYGLFAYSEKPSSQPLAIAPPIIFHKPLIVNDFRNTQGSKILPSLNPNLKYATHYYVNGIQNSLQDCISGAQTLLKTYGGQANIVPAYSMSFGIKNDLLSVRESKADPNYSSDFTRNFSTELQSNILHMEINRDPRKIFITCFSRGAADVYYSCKDFPEHFKNRLIITACGPIMILPKRLGFIVQNLISEGDWCSLTCNPELKEHVKAWKEKGIATYESEDFDVTILKQKDGFTGFKKDHFFQSKTYQEGISKLSISDYRKYGELE